MKTKLVLWGANAQEERVLIALELLAKENKVKIMTFTESVATEEFSQKMMQEWRNGAPMEMPEAHTSEIRELAVSDSLLPEELKVERGDLIQRAQTEWHFVVLSSKLNEAYQAELDEIKEKIDRLDNFDKNVWEGLKVFWNKVQTQVRDRNLFREHANSLRDNTNALFSRLKELRVKLDEDFQKKSKENVERFSGLLEGIEKKIGEGLSLQPIFDELKDLQRKFREADFTRDHRSKVWQRLDKAFKVVKERRFGATGDDRSPMERLKRRYEGLLSAIEKMERSIQRDQDDLQFQNRKIASTDGQLEAQIRQAKIKMIEERIRSKDEKLGEMKATKAELEKRMESQAQKEAKRQERQRLEDAKKIASEKIAAEIKQKAEGRVGDEKIEKALDALGVEENPKTATEEEAPADKKDSMIEAVSTTVGESVEDMVDTVKAVAEVVSDKVEDAVENLKDKVFGKTDDPAEETETPVAAAPAEESLTSKISDSVGDMVDKAKAAVEVVSDKVEDAVENLKDTVLGSDDEKAAETETPAAEAPAEESMISKISDSVGDMVDKAKAAAEVVSDKIEDAAEDLKDKILGDDDKTEGGEATEEASISDKVSDSVEGMVDKAKAVADEVSDKIGDAMEDLKDKLLGGADEDTEESKKEED